MYLSPYQKKVARLLEHFVGKRCMTLISVGIEHDTWVGSSFFFCNILIIETARSKKIGDTCNEEMD